jgi:hypothetical protein
VFFELIFLSLLVLSIMRDKELYLNRGEDNAKGPHAKGGKSTIDREALRSETGPPAKASQPG